MAFQPQDEYADLYIIHDNAGFETSQYSVNTIKSPKTTVTFSPITNVVNDQSPTSSSLNNCVLSTDEDPNGIEKNLLITPDMENNINDIINSEMIGLEDLSCDEQDDWLTNELNKVELESIDRSIQNRIMSIDNQPPTNIRRRYQSDGKRQIEKSRSKPMAIKLPNLQKCKLHPHQSFWLQLILITDDKNPANKVYIHIDQLEYHADDLPVCDHGFVRVPLTQTDIQDGIKQLARISIIKTKLDTYTFELIPFIPLTINDPVEIYENPDSKSIVAKAKCFRDAYNLNSSRIACQLLIKQNETWYATDIVCETDTMVEKEKQTNPKKSNKRSTSSNASDDEYEIHRQNSTKKRKRSSSLKKSLPITRAKRT